MKPPFLLLLATLIGSTAAAQPVAPESPPTVPVAELLPAEIVSGPGYTITPEVPTDGFLGVFQLHTRFGDFQCVGREMLFTRLQELRALERIDEVSKTKAFADAVARGAVGEPLDAAKKIVTDPVGSVEMAPVGVAQLFGKVAGGFGSFGKAVGKMAEGGGKAKDPDAPKPPPSREDPLGYNEARNEWARKFGVDPYTTNRPLALKLNHLGMITFGTDKVAGTGSGAVLGGFGPIAEWLSYLPDINDHLLTKSPADVTKLNARQLEQLGVSKRSMGPFLDNPWFSPTLQTRFVNSLAQMKGVANASVPTGLAGNVQSEEQARFLCGSLELLARGHADLPAPQQFRAIQGTTSITGAEGTLLVAGPVDLLSWTETVVDFATQHQPADGPAFLCVSGPLTERARAGFAAQGWQIRQFPSPREGVGRAAGK